MLVYLEGEDKEHVLDILREYRKSFPKSKLYDVVRSDVKNIIKKMTKNVVADISVAECHLIQQSVIFALENIVNESEKQTLMNLAVKLSLN